MNTLKTVVRLIKWGTIGALAILVLLPASLNWSDTHDVHMQRPLVTQTDMLIQQHGCWAGAAPADMQGRVPGHVIVNGAYRGGLWVHKALDQQFGGKDHHLTISAFCR